MTAIVTWNAQSGRGVDGHLDLDRCAAVIEALGEADVICLQEVIRFMPEIDDGAGADQVAALAARLPGFEPVFGAAFERAGRMPGRRAQYGNLVLARLPVLYVGRHPLPQPAEPEVKHMPRQATEVVVAAPGGPLRVVTTHLEYHSACQRLAQVERLRTLHREAAANDRTRGALPASGPYAPPTRPSDCIVCGDFNALPGDPVHVRMLAPFDDETPPFVDAWRATTGDTPHPPTCGVHDRRQWPEGPHCRDYFFATPGLARRIEAVAIDEQTDASDHQPLRLLLADPASS